MRLAAAAGVGRGWRLVLLLGYGARGPRFPQVLIMSNAAMSACAITRMAATDWKYIDEFARQLVKDAVECCGCSPEEYFSLAGEIELTKTHGRCAVGNMTTVAHALWADDIDMTEELQWRQMEELDHHSYRVTLRTMATAIPCSASRKASTLIWHGGLKAGGGLADPGKRGGRRRALGASTAPPSYLSLSRDSTSDPTAEGIVLIGAQPLTTSMPMGKRRQAIQPS